MLVCFVNAARGDLPIFAYRFPLHCTISRVSAGQLSLPFVFVVYMSCRLL
jgi:hypothetical protein